MKFSFTSQQEIFRSEIKNFLKKERDQGSFKTGLNSFIEAYSQEFSQKMGAKGYIGMTWPQKYGGQGRSYVERTILMEELLRVQAPISYHFIGDRQVGPALIHSGTKKVFLYIFYFNFGLIKILPASLIVITKISFASLYPFF